MVQLFHHAGLTDLITERALRYRYKRNYAYLLS